MTASVTVGRALRYADGSARGLLHHQRGHSLFGCSDREIMAFTDHTTSKEVDRYTKGARQRIVAASAMEKLSAEARRARLRVS